MPHFIAPVQPVTEGPPSGPVAAGWAGHFKGPLMPSLLNLDAENYVEGHAEGERASHL